MEWKMKALHRTNHFSPFLFEDLLRIIPLKKTMRHFIIYFTIGSFNHGTIRFSVRHVGVFLSAEIKNSGDKILPADRWPAINYQEVFCFFFVKKAENQGSGCFNFIATACIKSESVVSLPELEKHEGGKTW
jgi:hypothetical protein